MVNIISYLKQEKDAFIIGILGGYIAFLITSAQGFNFELFSAQPSLIDKFTTNAQTLATIDAMKPALVFIFISIAISLIVKRWFKW